MKLTFFHISAIELCYFVYFQKVNICALAISLLVMLVILILNYPFYHPNPEATPLHFGLTESFDHIIWSIAVCYIIFACRQDIRGPINWFLSLPMWQPLSRLSYSIYIFHYIVIKTTMNTLEIPRSFSEMSALQAYISIFVMSTFLAIPMTLAFELPIDAKKIANDTQNTKKISRSCNDNRKQFEK